jgi:hypothetical protein
MGDQDTVLDAAAARHLLRRTGFGALPRDVALLAGRTRGEAADAVLDFTPKAFTPSGPDFATAVGKWIKYMWKARSPCRRSWCSSGTITSPPASRRSRTSG